MAELIEHGLSFTEHRPDGLRKLGKRAAVADPVVHRAVKWPIC